MWTDSRTSKEDEELGEVFGRTESQVSSSKQYTTSSSTLYSSSTKQYSSSRQYSTSTPNTYLQYSATNNSAAAGPRKTLRSRQETSIRCVVGSVKTDIRIQWYS